MPKILDVECWIENLKLAKPYTIAFQTVESVENFFVKIRLDDGTWGIGSGAPAEFITGEPLLPAYSLLKERLPAYLVGKPISAIHGFCRSLADLLNRYPAAMAAADIALHDAFTKHLNIPLVDFWGRAHQSLPTSITIGIMDREATIKEGLAHVEAGFKVLKLKTGKEVTADIDTFIALRRAVGPEIKIRIDANQGYTPDDLNQFITATKPFDFEFIEQPFPKAHYRWLGSIDPSQKSYLMADEDLHFPDSALSLICAKAYPLFNIKLMKCGGLYRGFQIAQMAALEDIPLMWGCMDESIISISAALHLAFAHPNTKYLDLDGSLDLAKDVVAGGFILKDGLLSTLNKPGLGVELL